MTCVTQTVSWAAQPRREKTGQGSKMLQSECKGQPSSTGQHKAPPKEMLLFIFHYFQHFKVPQRCLMPDPKPSLHTQPWENKRFVLKVILAIAVTMFYCPHSWVEACSLIAFASYQKMLKLMMIYRWLLVLQSSSLPYWLDVPVFLCCSTMALFLHCKPQWNHISVSE